MPENDLLADKVIRQLFAELRTARDRYAANQSGKDEYERALRRVIDYLVHGIWPDELKPVEDIGIRPT